MSVAKRHFPTKPDSRSPRSGLIALIGDKSRAPAGLTALINQSLGKPVGFLQPQLYAAGAHSGFRDITQGNNGDYAAGPGWDACTGLGSPDGSALLQALGGKLAAGATP
jgi:kumamolisin